MPQYVEYHGVEYAKNALEAATKLRSMIKMSEDDEDYFVMEDSVVAAISEISGISIGCLDTGEKAQLHNLELEMGNGIKGQY
eukprot:1803837-Ditylum_brightwellii.AAC.1